MKYIVHKLLLCIKNKTGPSFTIENRSTILPSSSRRGLHFMQTPLLLQRTFIYYIWFCNWTTTHSGLGSKQVWMMFPKLLFETQIKCSFMSLALPAIQSLPITFFSDLRFLCTSIAFHPRNFCTTEIWSKPTTRELIIYYFARRLCTSNKSKFRIVNESHWQQPVVVQLQTYTIRSQFKYQNFVDS